MFTTSIVFIPNNHKMETGTKSTPYLKAIIYCRISSKRQQIGASLETQELMCLDYCKSKAYKVVKIVKEVISAKDMKDQVLLNEISNMEGIQVIVVYNISRFSRNVLQGLEMYNKLKEKSMRLESATEVLSPNRLQQMDKNGEEPNTSDYILVTLLNAAQHEIEMISQRVKHTMDQKRKRGMQYGRVPYGKKVCYNDDIRSFDIDEDEDKVIELVKMLRGKVTLKKANKLLKQIYKGDDFEPIILDDDVTEIVEGLSCENIANILNEYHLRDRKGELWKSSSVNNISSR
jgi:DNA invertase Pin-like site-specific DNA recombinase